MVKCAPCSGWFNFCNHLQLIYIYLLAESAQPLLLSVLTRFPEKSKAQHAELLTPQSRVVVKRPHEMKTRRNNAKCSGIDVRLSMRN
jgi:hypothetical protein